MKIIEKYLSIFLKKLREGKEASSKSLRPFSLVITLLFILDIILGVILILIPQVKVTASSITADLPGFTKNLQHLTTIITLKLPDVATQLDCMGINWQSLGKSISSILQAFGETVICLLINAKNYRPFPP